MSLNRSYFFSFLAKLYVLPVLFDAGECNICLLIISLTSFACSRYSCLQMYIFNDKSCLSCIYFFPMESGPLHDSNLVNNPAKDLKQLCQEHSRRWLVELLTASQLCVSKNKHVRMFVTMIIPNFHKSIRGTREKV